MDNNNENTPVSTEPMPAAPEQPASQPSPAAHAPMGGEKKGGMGKALTWVIIAVVVVVAIILLF